MSALKSSKVTRAADEFTCAVMELVMSLAFGHQHPPPAIHALFPNSNVHHSAMSAINNTIARYQAANYSHAGGTLSSMLMEDGIIRNLFAARGIGSCEAKLRKADHRKTTDKRIP